MNNKDKRLPYEEAAVLIFNIAEGDIIQTSDERGVNGPVNPDAWT